METTYKDKTGIRVIPPVIFLTALAIGFGADWIWPVALLPDPVQYGIGAILIVASFVPVPWILRSFRRADTSLDVRRAANNLVTAGPFRYSRNPIYVSLITLCIGIAIAADNVWVLAAVGLATLYLYHFVVLAEERHLEARFGEQYLKYKSEVRRWL